MRKPNGENRRLRQYSESGLAVTEPAYLSPVTLGAALHFGTWVPNFGIQKYMRHSEQTDEVFPHDYVFRDGRLHCGESPGHGVGIDEKRAERFPYSPKQLPIARLEDGSMWDW